MKACRDELKSVFVLLGDAQEHRIGFIGGKGHRPNIAPAPAIDIGNHSGCRTRPLLRTASAGPAMSQSRACPIPTETGIRHTVHA